MGKDEMEFSRLPSNADSQFFPERYGGTHPMAFREAINWIDASSPNYAGAGLLAASDTTLHHFRDETANPAAYPVLQHVLLSTRKSLAWNPGYWFTQPGTHRYRMALFPHDGDWRLRYRDAIAFNRRLVVFAGALTAAGGRASLPASFLSLDPHNLVLTAMKKCEDDDRIVVRFYEAEGNECTARIKLPVPILKGWKASLIEEDEAPMEPLSDGSIEIPVGPWEIVTLKLALHRASS
jgi:alpha-mannosidase